MHRLSATISKSKCKLGNKHILNLKNEGLSNEIAIFVLYRTAEPGFFLSPRHG